MPDVGASAFVVAVGNFNQGYLLVRVVDMRITVDDNISTKGQILFYVRSRYLGDVMNDDAIKLVKCATS